MSERVLVVAAHPDDEVLGMGGTIALHSTVLGDAVRVVCVTDGSSTQYPGDSVKRDQKNAEAVRAAAALGVSDYVHLDLPDMRLDTIPHAELNAVVEEQVRDFRPEVVYTVHPDVNRDHRELFDSVAVATRRSRAGGAPRPHLRADLQRRVDAGGRELVPPQLVRGHRRDHRGEARRVRLLRTEERPPPHPRNERGIRAHAEYYGTGAGCEFAEPFVLVRSLSLDDRSG